MTESPLVSIGLAVYNGEKHIVRAINSVVNQSYTNWELIIVNDGSTDSTVALIETFNDSRITLLHNNKNLGVTPSRNKYLHAAQGKYLAVIDADDEWLQSKLENQVKFLEKNKGYGICGCYANRINDTTSYIWKYPITDEEIRVRLIWGSAVIHSSILLRLSIIRGNNLCYDEKFKQAEDYNLIAQCVILSKAYNIPQALVNYYEHGEQLTTSNNEEQVANSSKASLSYLNTIGVKFSLEESSLLRRQHGYHLSFNLEELNVLWDAFRKILDNKKEFFNHCILSKSIQSRVYMIAASNKLNLQHIKSIKNMKLISWMQMIKLMIKNFFVHC